MHRRDFPNGHARVIFEEPLVMLDPVGYHAAFSLMIQIYQWPNTQVVQKLGKFESHVHASVGIHLVGMNCFFPFHFYIVCNMQPKVMVSCSVVHTSFLRMSV